MSCIRKQRRCLCRTTAGLSGSALVLVLSLAGAMLAQSGEPAPGPNHDVKIHSTAAGATPWAEPGPGTPVPQWAQQSYQIYLQMRAKANGGTLYTRTAAYEMPDWSGLWTLDGSQGFSWDGPSINTLARGIGAPSAQAILDHCPTFPCQGWLLAALTPRYALQYRQKLAAVAHDVEWDPLSDCLPPGFPRTLIDPFGREFIDTPGETWLTAQTLNDTRRIYTDGRGHIPQDEAFSLWDGDSIGFWDRDTLVVHTLYMRENELQRNQPSLSEEASVIERIRMTGPDTIEDEATIYDPLALREPWHTVIKYDRMTTAHNRMDMYSCDPNVYQTEEGRTDIIIPGQSVTIKRDYRNPENNQNFGLDKVTSYGAKLLKSP